MNHVHIHRPLKDCVVTGQWLIRFQKEHGADVLCLKTLALAREFNIIDYMASNSNTPCFPICFVNS